MSAWKAVQGRSATDQLKKCSSWKGENCTNVLLPEYENRTSWKYEPIHGAFHTHEGLTNKVDQDGSYVVFPRTTVVFRPDKRCLQTIALMQRVLYQQLQETGMLMPPLPASTIHMTLHDLVSSEQCVSDAAHPRAYEHEMAESLHSAVRIVEGIRRDYAGRKITMVADRILLYGAVYDGTKGSPV